MDHSQALAKLDHPLVRRILFHPRRQPPHTPPAGAVDWSARAADGVRLAGRLYLREASWPNILFFHGNGEIAADYDTLGPMFHSIGANLLAMDYRGYGKSEGAPGVSAMLEDARTVYDALREWLRKEGRGNAPFFIMGRSLGSAPALELAAAFQPEIAGLVIESGFAHTFPLLAFLGLDTAALGLDEAGDAIANLEKIKDFHKPALIIHAEHDHIIPRPQGEELYDACPAAWKRLYTVPGANHNDIHIMAGMRYFHAVKELLAAAS
jgi:fermentation-respiration switch protein FrsA (DUF1100 family)